MLSHSITPTARGVNHGVPGGRTGSADWSTSRWSCSAVVLTFFMEFQARFDSPLAMRKGPRVRGGLCFATVIEGYGLSSLRTRAQASRLASRTSSQEWRNSPRTVVQPLARWAFSASSKVMSFLVTALSQP